MVRQVCGWRTNNLTCDAILFNFLGAERVSIGTCIELGWGDAFRKPMVLVMEDEANAHEHSMVRQVCGWRTNNLDDAVQILRAILLP
jgi:nucleoside 2-deoxyribosyltransferase